MSFYFSFSFYKFLLDLVFSSESCFSTVFMDLLTTFIYSLYYSFFFLKSWFYSFKSSFYWVSSNILFYKLLTYSLLSRAFLMAFYFWTINSVINSFCLLVFFSSSSNIVIYFSLIYFSELNWIYISALISNKDLYYFLML